jgi:starvation-inducible DNA-binding protein
MVQTQAAVSEVQPQEFPTRTFLTDQQRRTSIQTLNRILADSVVLLSQARYAHWNVRGPQFFQLHELFEDLAELLEDQIDEIAERITSLGGQARGTVHQVAPKSQVKRIPPSVVQGMEFVEVLADSIAVYDATLTQAIYTANDVEDLDTADLLNELSREIGKYLWFLEAHLPIQAVGSQMGGSQQQQI